MSRAQAGWVPEWSIGHAWKACVPQGTEGSNPSPSANSFVGTGYRKEFVIDPYLERDIGVEKPKNR